MGLIDYLVNACAMSDLQRMVPQGNALYLYK